MKLIVPFAAGSTPDVTRRMLTDYLQNKFGQTFIVENRPGASGNTGTDAVAKAEPDGYTLGMSILGPLGINAILFGQLPYDPAKDLSFVTMLVTQPNALAVNTGLGVNTVPELIALLKANPGKYNYGSIGNGSLSHMSMEAIVLKAGSKMVHVPYRRLARRDDRADARRRADGQPSGDRGNAACGERSGENPCDLDGRAVRTDARHSDADGKRHRRPGRCLERADCAGQDPRRDR